MPGVSRLAARAEAERRARRRRVARRITRTALGLAPIGGLVYVLFGTTALGVDSVEVTGTERTPVAEVVAAAGLPPGMPLARVDLDDVEAAVGRLAPVDDVTVRRSWPGTVQVAVRERVAVAVSATPEGMSLVDREGVAFALVPEAPPGLVRLEVPGAVRPDDPSTAAALQVWRELPATLRGQVETVRATSATWVVLLLAGERQVVWGAPGGAASKAAATTALLALPGKVVDVSAPGVAVRR